MRYTYEKTIFRISIEKMITSKSIDLLEKSEHGEMKKFHKPAKELLILKILKMQ